MSKRWVRIGGDSGVEGLATASGVDKLTIYRLGRQASGGQARVETRERVAMTLHFRDWDEMWAAYVNGDFLQGLAWVLVTPLAFEAAQRGAKVQGVTVEEFVSSATIVAEKAAREPLKK